MTETTKPYLLLTPGPLTTTDSVKQTMLRDWCTWDDDYNQLVQVIRSKLVSYACGNAETQSRYSCVLMQGSGSFSVESVIGSAIPQNGKLLILSNGAYGERIAKIAATLNINYQVYRVAENQWHQVNQLEAILAEDSTISHVTAVHCETTTGILNPIEALGKVVKRYEKTWIVDAMSSFGGIPMAVDGLGIDFLISSANKCIQGVPGFGFIIATHEALKACEGHARSHSLDLFDQWYTMEQHSGKWRFTSPTHVVRAFLQALNELDQEGGIGARYRRYRENHRKLVQGMESLGFSTIVASDKQSPFITTFAEPVAEAFDFREFYQRLKARGFVIYPGKITDTDCFRIGHIGEVYPSDIESLLQTIEQSRYWL